MNRAECFKQAICGKDDSFMGDSATGTWDADATQRLQQLLGHQQLGVHAEGNLEAIVVNQVDSTNTRLKEYLTTHADSGSLLLVAKEQTAGRGRQGRCFASPLASGIYFSWSMPVPQDFPMEQLPVLALLAALALAQVCECHGVVPVIKWPNDLLWQGKKLSGILTEGVPGTNGSLAHVIVGIGINLYQEETDFLPQLRDFAGSLEMAGWHCSDPIELVAQVIGTLEELVQQGNYWRQMDKIVVQYTARMAWRGEQVLISRGNQTATGTLLGINAEGELLVQQPTGMAIFRAGEVHLRRMKICSFTGNRTLSHRTDRVEQALDQLLESLIAQGYGVFRAGGAVGFDTLAAACVLRKKAQYPHLRLELLLPYEKRETDLDRLHILQNADHISVLCPEYQPGCMAKRNFALVDGSDLLVSYNPAQGRGTTQTITMAARKHVSVCPLTVEGEQLIPRPNGL